MKKSNASIQADYVEYAKLLMEIIKMIVDYFKKKKDSGEAVEVLKMCKTDMRKTLKACK